MSGAHGAHVEGGNKRIALLISVLALCLAIAETFAKGAQTEALGRNVEASNLWAFFQAKTVRQTVVRTAKEQLDVERARAKDEPGGAEALAKLQESWGNTIARWESEPETGEGRKELTARAKHAEEERDTALAKYHQLELSSAAFQIAIVLASSTVITGIVALAWLAGGLGLVGVALAAVGLISPHAIHIF